MPHHHSRCESILDRLARSCRQSKGSRSDPTERGGVHRIATSSGRAVADSVHHHHRTVSSHPSELGGESLPYGRVELDRDALTAVAVSDVVERLADCPRRAEPRFVSGTDLQGNPFPAQSGDDWRRVSIGEDDEPCRTMQLTHVSMVAPPTRFRCEKTRLTRSTGVFRNESSVSGGWAGGGGWLTETPQARPEDPDGPVGEVW